ncbi:MAG: P-loop NTPase [Oscillospiraceae bacterium]|jgi:septum site-determining protein MinD|nr:P-loop NTPase [Oscillospiraceae bacterium]
MAQIIALASGKGGVGKSTVSALLAQAMAARGHKVLLIDCDIGLRSLDLILGVDEHALFTWADVVLGRCSLQQAVMVCRENIHLLCAPLQPERALTDGVLRQLVQTCRVYDVILIDAPAGLGFGFRMAMKAAARCLLVSTPDPVCVRSVSVAARQALRLGVKDVRLLINRFDAGAAARGGLVALDDVIDQTEAQLIGVFPQEPRLFYRNANGAALRDSPVVRAAARVAARIDGENVPLEF